MTCVRLGSRQPVGLTIPVRLGVIPRVFCSPVLVAVAMVETRVAPRHRVKMAAKIEYGGDKVACTIRDLSITGAALELSEIVSRIPATFTLVVPEAGLKLPCHVVWRKNFQIGVAFD
jgi:hypothetical protein